MGLNLVDRFWRYDLERLASDTPIERVDWAKRAAASHPSVLIYPKLEITERNYTWVLLYEFIQNSQIAPKHLRRMRNNDLEYLAASNFEHPGLDEDKQAKVAANIERARRELGRRYTIQTGLITGGIIAAFASALTAVSLSL